MFCTIHLDSSTNISSISFKDNEGKTALSFEGDEDWPTEILPGLTSLDISSGSDHLVILTNKGITYTISSTHQAGTIFPTIPTGDPRLVFSTRFLRAKLP